MLLSIYYIWRTQSNYLCSILYFPIHRNRCYTFVHSLVIRVSWKKLCSIFKKYHTSMLSLNYYFPMCKLWAGWRCFGKNHNNLFTLVALTHNWLNGLVKRINSHYEYKMTLSKQMKSMYMTKGAAFVLGFKKCLDSQHDILEGNVWK